MEKKVQIFVFMLIYRSFVLLVFIVTEASLVSHDEYGDVHFIFAGMWDHIRVRRQEAFYPTHFWPKVG